MDNSKCINNIYTISKSKGIKIGDLEVELELSKGYFARLKREGDTFPAVDKICLIADKLGISIDKLLNSEVDELSENDSMKISFMEKLYTNTSNHNIVWNKYIYNEKETKQEFDPACDKVFGYYSYYLSEKQKKFMNDNQLPYEIGIEKGIFYSTNLPGTEVTLVIADVTSYDGICVSAGCIFDDGYGMTYESGISMYMVGENVELLWNDKETNAELNKNVESIVELVSKESYTSNTIMQSMQSFLDYKFE